MSDHNFQGRSGLVTVLLTNACEGLFGGTDKSALSVSEDSVVRDLVEKELFVLALSALAKSAEKITPDPKFWDSLAKAARELGLREQAEEFQFRWARSASLALQHVLKKP